MNKLLQPYLVINVTRLVQFGNKFRLHLTFTCLLKLLAKEHHRETNISIIISHLWLFNF